MSLYFDVSVVVDGKELRKYTSSDYPGIEFVVSEVGKEYQLKLASKYHAKTCVVPTVDGLSILDGKPGDMFASSGYVLNGYSSAAIPGWRLDNEKVAKFVFAEVPESYAASKGDASNVGVIGAAVFLTKNEPKTRYISSGSMYSGDDYKSMNWASAGPQHCNSSRSVKREVAEKTSGGIDFDSDKGTKTCSVGTGFGDSTAHHVSEIDFKKADKPAQIITIRYDTYDNLKRMGVIKERSGPDPFPANKDTGCEPPAGWNG